MGYELNRLMKQYGVSSFSLPQYSGVKAPSDTVIPDTKNTTVGIDALKAKPKYYTAPIAPTMPVMPTAPTAFDGTTPIAPAPLPKKGATAEQTAEYKVSNAQYLADLNKFKADQAAAKTAQTTYEASLKSYPDLMKTYNTNLTKFNTDKTTWDELQRKYDLDQKSYNDYVTDYKARMSNAPQRLGSEFVQGKSLMQSRPNTSMGQTTLPENNLIPITQPALNSTDINSWVKQNPYANNQVMQDYQKSYFSPLPIRNKRQQRHRIACFQIHTNQYSEPPICWSPSRQLYHSRHRCNRLYHLDQHRNKRGPDL
jgi:hypothetical protein